MHMRPPESWFGCIFKFVPYKQKPSYTLLPKPLAAQTDLDLGSSGAVVIKDKYIFTGGKQGPLYIANAANLGGYAPDANNTNVFQARFDAVQPASSVLL